VQAELTPELVDRLTLLVSLTLLIATPFFILFAKRAAKALAQMAGIKSTEEHEVLIDKAVRAAVSYAEEQAHKRLRGLIEGGPTSGAEKLAVAKSAAVTIAKSPLDARKVGDKQLEVRIEAEVQERKRLASLPPGATLVSIPPMPPAPGLPALTSEMIREHVGETIPARPRRGGL
jgi:hypothetical protein